VAAGTALVQREPGLEVEITIDGYRVAALLRAVEMPGEAAPQRDRWQGQVSALQAALVQAECRVAAAALKCKAARLGSIKRLIDDPQTGSLSITIEV
jgi:hypothetical protein